MITAVIIAAVIIGGFAYDFVRVRSALDSIEVSLKDVSITSVSIPSEVDLRVTIGLRNNEDYMIVVDRVIYDIYVNGAHVAHGSKRDVVIYPSSTTDVDLPVTVSLLDAAESLVSSIMEGTIDVEVRGVIEAPVRWYGIVRTFTVSVPFEVTNRVSLYGGGGGQAVEVVEARFDPPQVVFGDSVDVVVTLESEQQLTAEVRVVIREDIAIAPDQDVYEHTEIVSFPGTRTIRFTWTPPEPSTGNLRGYHLEVYVDGTKVYSMPSSYPPRLKVLPRYEQTTTAPAQQAGTLTVINTYWVVNGQQTYVAHVGDEIKACVIVKASGGYASGTVVVEVRKDKAFMPDESLRKEIFTVNLGPEETGTLCVTFTARERSSTWFRGYFIEVYIDGEKAYTMPSDYPPRLRVD